MEGIERLLLSGIVLVPDDTVCGVTVGGDRYWPWTGNGS